QCGRERLVWVQPQRQPRRLRLPRGDQRAAVERLAGEAADRRRHTILPPQRHPRVIAPARQQLGEERAPQPRRARRFAHHQRRQLPLVADENEPPRKAQRAQQRGRRELRRLIYDGQIEVEWLADPIVAFRRPGGRRRRHYLRPQQRGAQLGWAGLPLGALRLGAPLG